MLCSELHSQKGFNIILLSNRIGPHRKLQGKGVEQLERGRPRREERGKLRLHRRRNLAGKGFNFPKISETKFTTQNLNDTSQKTCCLVNSILLECLYSRPFSTKSAATHNVLATSAKWTLATRQSPEPFSPEFPGDILGGWRVSRVRIEFGLISNGVSAWIWYFCYLRHAKA